MNGIKQPIYKRQRYLLAFIRQLNTVVVTDLQKLIFLHSMSSEVQYYNFVPYKYGAFSFQLSEDLDILQRDGYITINIEGDGKKIKAIGMFTATKLFQIAPERGNKLIYRTYRQYPYYALNSEIRKRIFDAEELENFEQEIKKAYAKTAQVLFTIGYEGRSIETFVNTLIQNDIRLLCDVRKNPLSHKFGFSKGKLSHIMQTIGIKYIHIPQLGIESDKRVFLKTPQDYRYLFADYEKILPSRQSYLDDIYSCLQKNIRISLMCFEFDPQMCHRHVIKDYLVRTKQVTGEDL